MLSTVTVDAEGGEPSARVFQAALNVESPTSLSTNGFGLFLIAFVLWLILRSREWRMGRRLGCLRRLKVSPSLEEQLDQEWSLRSSGNRLLKTSQLASTVS